MRAVPLALLTLAALLALPAAAAHQTAYSADGRLRFTYGSLGEPVYTFQKSGLDLGVFDNATGAPIEGLAASEGAQPGAIGFRLWLVHAGQELELTPGLRTQFGRAGWYTYPYMLTEPGGYALRIDGTINGTPVQQTIPPRHDIQGTDSIMWPQQYPTPDTLESRLEAVERQLAAQDGGDSGTGGAGGGSDKGSPGPLWALPLALLAVALVLRRR